MDTHNLGANALPMAKSSPNPAPNATPRLYVGPWIRANRLKPAEVARKTGINEGYLSGIISGKKKNPSTEKLALIADFLKMPLGDLYKPPPPDRLLEQLDDYDPETVIRLSQKRRKSG